MLLLLLLRIGNLHHHRRRHLCHHNRISKSPFSSSLSSPQSSHSPNFSSDSIIPKPTSLSSRMSFVFDQIDSIEKERSEKDQTLQRIRSWRESKRQQFSITETITPAVEAFSEPEAEAGDFVKDLELSEDENEGNLGFLNGKRKVELVHPWPEWIELMERLLQQNYFDHRRKDEDGMMENLGFNLSEIEEDGFDLLGISRLFRLLCLILARIGLIYLGHCQDRIFKFWLVMDAPAQTSRWFSLQNC